MLQLLLTLFANKTFEPLNRKIHRLSNRLMGIGNHENLSISGEAYALQYLLKNHTLETVFDIGAHDGGYMDQLRKAGYYGTIYAFEPHPITFSRLQDNVSENAQNRLYQLAFSSKSGKSVIFDRKPSEHQEGTHHASMHSEVLKDLHHAEYLEYEITMNTLDAFLKSEDVKKIDFLKIDTEGHEFSILQGASESLKNGIIACIQFEFGQMNVVSRVFFKDFYDLLSPNYSIYRMLPSCLLEIKSYDPELCEVFHYQNYLALRKK